MFAFLAPLKTYHSKSNSWSSWIFKAIFLIFSSQYFLTVLWLALTYHCRPSPTDHKTSLEPLLSSTEPSWRGLEVNHIVIPFNLKKKLFLLFSELLQKLFLILHKENKVCDFFPSKWSRRTLKFPKYATASVIPPISNESHRLYSRL